MVLNNCKLYSPGGSTGYDSDSLLTRWQHTTEENIILVVVSLPEEDNF